MGGNSEHRLAQNGIRVNFFFISRLWQRRIAIYSQTEHARRTYHYWETSKPTGKIISLPENETNHVSAPFSRIFLVRLQCFLFLLLSFRNSFGATRITRYVCNIKEASEARIPLILREIRNAGRIHLQIKKKVKRAWRRLDPENSLSFVEVSSVIFIIARFYIRIFHERTWIVHVAA